MLTKLASAEKVLFEMCLALSEQCVRTVLQVGFNMDTIHRTSKRNKN